MSLIPGPSRAFGISETKNQNAVIKVYSASELKNALSKIYQIPNGVGTIQIAGDITINKPIQLKQFIASDNGPKEIIIEAVSGSKILNSRSLNDSAITLDNVIFDMGYTQPNDAAYQNTCKYTFKDLTINSSNAQYFYSFLKWTSYSAKGTPTQAFCGPISIINIKITKLLYMYQMSGGSSPANDYLISSNINGLILNNETTATAFNTCIINIPTLVCLSNNFTNFSCTNYLNTTNTNLNFYSQGDSPIVSQNNIFINILLNLKILESISTANSYGRGIIIGAGYPVEIPRASGWELHNVNMSSNLDPSGVAYNDGFRTQFPAGNKLPNETNINGVDFVGFAQNTNNDATIEHIHVFNSSGSLIGGYQQIKTPDFPTDSRYVIEWKITGTSTITNQENTYHMLTTVKNVAGTLSILDNSMLYAYEEQPDQVYGLIPTITGNAICINPYGLVTWKFDGSYKITGYKIL